ncbi:MAG: universal stress protein [Candidatus Dormibacteraeota bacterium]|uniref:Universal stress protein n=1 Tax=Candidatus Amunia macphersoniae TaxID=3127014 RepID=A0A934KEN2_9BACT|nr:universal stress protein [Candidatus Dormibacteraeota bacterium]
MTTTRVVCAVDGSPPSRAAVGFALDEAELRGIPLQLVVAHATLSARWSGDARLATQLTGEQAHEMESLAHHLLDSVIQDRGRPSGVPATVELLNGPPAEVIEEHLQPTDLLVIGSRGLGGVRRLLLGSVSGALVQTAPCPVVVVRPQRDPEASDPSASTGRY